MTDFAAFLAPDKGETATPIHIVDKATLGDFEKSLSERARAALQAQAMQGEAGSLAILPRDGAGPGDWLALVAVKDAAALTSWCLAGAASRLPAGTYRLTDGDAGAAMFGWAAAQHGLTRYKAKAEEKAPRLLLCRDAARIPATIAEVGAVALVRDLVDTPAADMGPADLEGAVERVAKAHGGTVSVVRGDTLEQEYPMVHAVGRAAARGREPRLIQLSWGDDAHPLVAIIGKGVCFDSGGLDIKPPSGMALMKKDMGGAAHAIALAQLVMAARLKVKLLLLVPAVENSISGGAMRPGDIVRSRKGLFVEIDNTDAEGRLILGDALALAGEAGPALILDFATLTGAARVALGPDLPPLFCNDDGLAADILAGGAAKDDPLWRMPLWDGYDAMLKSDLADITNSPAGGFAGAITAALFLRRFVPDATPWAHIDTFAWNPAAKPGRPKGGAALGLRATWAMLQQRFGA
ncbi:MAG: leucyl aminopeptidase family protein [Sphingomonadaceae bacterium]|nr:leucyl aminopeptidase family protein [Sphingomonadaceae bacterium]